MGARTRKTWGYHPSGGGRINHPSRERPVEPDASRGARPVRGRLLAVNLFGRRVQSPVSIPCVRSTHAERGRPGQTSACVPKGPRAEAEVIEAGERESVRANPPTGFGPKPVRQSGFQVLVMGPFNVRRRRELPCGDTRDRGARHAPATRMKSAGGE